MQVVGIVLGHVGCTRDKCRITRAEDGLHVKAYLISSPDFQTGTRRALQFEIKRLLKRGLRMEAIS